MPRRRRAVFPGLAHHVTHRGNRRGDVYFSDSDRVTYLDWFGQYCGRHGVEVLAYCLMTNHMHAVLVPATREAFAQLFRALHTRYAMRVNRDRNWSGHVWQGRHFSAALDDSYLWTAVRYVERNPVRAGMVTRAEEYRWSSGAAHCGLRSDPLLTQDASWLIGLETGEPWSRWLAEADDPAKIDVLRANVMKGLPCGNTLFLAALERDSGRSLRSSPPGRPGKHARDRSVPN